MLERRQRTWTWSNDSWKQKLSVSAPKTDFWCHTLVPKFWCFNCHIHFECSHSTASLWNLWKLGEKVCIFRYIYTVILKTANKSRHQMDAPCFWEQPKCTKITDIQHFGPNNIVNNVINRFLNIVIIFPRTRSWRTTLNVYTIGASKIHIH